MAVHVLRREERGIEGVRVSHRKRFFPPTSHNRRLSHKEDALVNIILISLQGYLKYDSFEVGNN
ncbi:unnamed protein product [Musa banksii]